MCEFLSGLISDDGETVKIADFISHYETRTLLNLPTSWGREFEWTEESPDSLVVRVPEDHPHNANWYKACILATYPTRTHLVNAFIKEVAKLGNVNLSGCTGLKELLKDLNVKGGLFLSDCTGLKELPTDLKVNGYLFLRGCTGLEELPSGLKVDGYLNLYGCTGLKELPKDLKVKGDLYLHGCTGLKTLPTGLIVKGEVIGFNQ